jgi:hypothetical protein
MSLKSLSRLYLGASLLLPAIVHGAYPLITEDTGTQGAGGWQLELIAEIGEDRDAGVTERTANLAAVLSWGATDNLDLILGLPYQRVTVEQGGTRDTESGGGDIAMGLKWRFYEKDLLSLALRPGITIPVGDENRELGAGNASYSLYLVTTYAPEPWEFDLHFGYMNYPNELDEREDRWHFSMAGGYTFSNELQLVVDLGTVTNPDPAVSDKPVFLIIGAIYPVSKGFELSIGYKQGLSGPETDSTLLAGVTLHF